jgi:hypothetical protein
MAYDFDGSNDSMERAQPYTVSVPLTLACWARSDAVNLNRVFVQLASEPIGGSSGTVGNSSVHLGHNSTGNVVARANVNNGISSSSSGSAMAANTWYHTCAVFFSTTSRLAYIDGVAGTDAGGTRGASNFDNLILATGSGGTYSLSNFYNGKLAEVGVWDVALSADEIKSLSQGAKPTSVRPDSLISYVPLVREAQDTCNGDMTSAGGPTVFVHPRRYG